MTDNIRHLPGAETAAPERSVVDQFVVDAREAGWNLVRRHRTYALVSRLNDEGTIVERVGVTIIDGRTRVSRVQFSTNDTDVAGLAEVATSWLREAR